MVKDYHAYIIMHVTVLEKMEQSVQNVLLSYTSDYKYRTLALLRPLRCYAPPPLFSAKLLLRVTFCSLIRPPLTHAHMCLACSYLNVYSSTTLLLRCYLCYNIMCSLVPLWKAAYVWYRTMTAILLRRERGVTTQRCMQFSLLRPPPLFSAKLRFKRGGVTTREYGTCTEVNLVKLPVNVPRDTINIMIF